MSTFVSEQSRIERSLQGKTPSLLPIGAHSTQGAYLPQTKYVDLENLIETTSIKIKKRLLANFEVHEANFNL